jgi:hypothetical protein
MIIQQRQHVDEVECCTLCSRLISKSIFGILQIPSGSIAHHPPLPPGCGPLHVPIQHTYTSLFCAQTTHSVTCQYD